MKRKTNPSIEYVLVELDKKADASKENRSCGTVNECSGAEDVASIGGAVDNEDEVNRMK